MKYNFNPIKEDKSGVKTKRIIWDTNSINLAITGLEQGRKLIGNPFYENNTKLLKGDLVFNRTNEEINEWKKCAEDIIYFSNKYCKLLTPDGIQNIKLRDYQEKYLKHLEKTQLSIYLACRQCGKCVSFLSKIICNINFNIANFNKKQKYFYKKYFDSKKNVFDIPLFEIYNCYDNSVSWKFLYFLYKIINKYKLKHNNIFYLLIEFIDKIKSKNNYKFIKSFNLEGLNVLTDSGFKKSNKIYMTKPFNIYELILDNGYKLHCADEHILYNIYKNQIYAKDLKIGDYIITNNGPIKIININILNKKISMVDITIDDINHRYYSNNILSHNTTTSAIYLLHYILFNVDKNSLVLGNKRKTAIEILDKLKKIFIELPYFLKPGIYKWNESEIVCDNGCRCMAEATTINSGISFTFHCVLADEFAHISPNILDKFYNNLFPTITAGKSKFIITSTQNGYNLFYRLYKSAEAGENEYLPFKTDWYEVPEWNPDTHEWEKRTDDWRRKQIANYGSEEAFNKQFGTNFDISANTLISLKILNKNKENIEIWKEKDLPGVLYSQYYSWKPSYNPVDELKNDYIIITIDLAEGIGMDNTVFLINRLINPNSNDIECVGMFKSNSLNLDEYTKSLQLLCGYYCNFDKLLISYERNVYGDLFYQKILDNIDKDNIICNSFDISVIVKYYNDKNNTYKPGIKITSGNKTSYCLIFKSDYEKNHIINNNILFFNELNNFCNDGNNKYRASFGNDDIVMAQIQIEYVKDTIQYKLLKQEFDYKNNNTTKNEDINIYQSINKYSQSFFNFNTNFDNNDINIYNF